nr:MAG TPA: minor structural protein [Caudoviricetes sp.]
MNKEQLIALGLTEEQAEKVLSANTEQLKGFIPKSRFDEVNNAKKNLETQLTERDNQLKELKKNNKDNEELQSTIKRLEDENKSAKEKYESDLLQVKKDNLIDNALNAAKAKNSKAVKALLDLEKVKFENETLSGLDEQLKALQEADDSKFLFEMQEAPKQPNFSGLNPGTGNTENKDVNAGPKLYSQMMAELNQ